MKRYTMAKEEWNCLIEEMRADMNALPAEYMDNIIDRLIFDEKLTATDISNMKERNVLCKFKILLNKYNIPYDRIIDSDYFGGVDNKRIRKKI